MIQDPLAIAAVLFGVILLALLLVNQGLEDVVRLAPASAWREALARAYR